MTIRVIPNLISPEHLKIIDDKLQYVTWKDGKSTAHGAAKDVKNNLQSIEQSMVLDIINKIVVNAIKNSGYIENLIIPTYVIYPMLNKHEKGDYYGRHVDRPMRKLVKEDKRVRCDLSISVFLTDKTEYEGGELHILEGDVTHKVKLNKGDAVIYPTSYIHEVKEVTEGSRICSVTWIQSAIADAAKRDVIFDIVKLGNILAEKGLDAETQTLLSKVRNNLTRQWCEF